MNDLSYQQRSSVPSSLIVRCKEAMPMIPLSDLQHRVNGLASVKTDVVGT